MICPSSWLPLDLFSSNSSDSRASLSLTLFEPDGVVDLDDSWSTTSLLIARFARNPGRMRPGLHDQVVVFNHSWQSAIRNFERFVKKMRGVKLHG